MDYTPGMNTTARSHVVEVLQVKCAICAEPCGGVVRVWFPDDTYHQANLPTFARAVEAGAWLHQYGASADPAAWVRLTRSL